MSISPKSSRVTILVKALPQPSKKYGETVCCAGVTEKGEWKRLFPVRFRHLVGDSSFGRWDWVDFQYRHPTSDKRNESCHVFEDTILINGKLPESERSRLLEPLVQPSAAAAARKGHSLTLIRPKKSKFIWKPKTKSEISDEKSAFQRAARQTSFFDKQLADIEPTPFDFRFKFTDDSGEHNYQNGDWEAHAMFWNQSRRTNINDALMWMDNIFNAEYPKNGMVFALGNQAKRPQTWQLLGVIRLNIKLQQELFFK